MAQRGGSVVSHVRFGKEVHSPLIPVGMADILVSLEELEGLRYIGFLKRDGKVVFNRNITVPSTVRPDTSLRYPEDTEERLKKLGYSLIGVDAKAIAKGLGNPKVENIAVLGLLSNYLPLSDEIWRQTISKSVPPKTLEVNLLAFQRGRDMVKATN